MTGDPRRININTKGETLQSKAVDRGFCFLQKNVLDLVFKSVKLQCDYSPLRKNQQLIDLILPLSRKQQCRKHPYIHREYSQLRHFHPLAIYLGLSWARLSYI